MTADTEIFGGTLYTDEALTDGVGAIGVSFPDFPGADDETFFCSGGGAFNFTDPFTGGYSLTRIYGSLKTKQDKYDPGMTTNQVTKLRKKSKLKGWDSGTCSGTGILLFCESTWTAKWIEAPPWP